MSKTIYLYAATRNRKAKLHLGPPDHPRYFCGSSLLGHLVSDNVELSWVENAKLCNRGHTVEVTACEHCLRAAEKYLTTEQ